MYETIETMIIVSIVYSTYLQTVVTVRSPEVVVELPSLHFESAVNVVVVVGKYSEPSPVALTVHVHSVEQLDKEVNAITAMK